jgi:hypothetical protein
MNISLNLTYAFNIEDHSWGMVTWCEAADRHPSNREFTTSRSSPCPLAGTPAPLHDTIIPHPKSFQRVELWPRRHAAQQHVTKRPHPIGQARGHRRRTGPPPFG